MAAASSMTSSSAWPSFTASPGWMYCSDQTRREEVLPCYHHFYKLSTAIGREEGGSGLIYLDRLPMFFEDVHPHYSFVELWI